MQTPRLVPAQSPRRSLCGLEQRLLARCRRLDLPPGATVAVGFSGGPDSLALAALLGRIASRADIRPALIHVDHGLRSSSASEQERAADLAAALQLPLHPLRIAGDPRARHPGVGLEEAARRERYRALAWHMTAIGATLIALGHHQHDQAETTLLHLLRGAGVSGAAGMAERVDRRVPWWDHEDPTAPTDRITIWRPLLTEPRATVRAYAQSTGLSPIADPSNLDHELRRNALRHEALPLLERVSPGATAALARYATLAAADDQLLEDLCEEPYRQAVTADGRLTAAPLAGLPLPLIRRVVRRWLDEWASLSSLSSDRVDAVPRLLHHGEGGRRIEIGDGFHVIKDRAGLRIVPPKGEPDKETG